MAGILITRRRLIVVGAIALLIALFSLWYLQPDRRLRRAWNDLLGAVEARNASRLGRVLAEDYADRWGYTRRPLLDDARIAFFQFRRLAVSAEQLRIERRDNQATITALLRIEAEGTGQIPEARAEVNGLFTPFTFEWRREPGLFGAWKLVRFDHAELDLARYRPRW